MSDVTELPGHRGYTLRLLEPAEFRPFWEVHHPQVFGIQLRLQLDAILSDRAGEVAADEDVRRWLGMT